MASLTKTCRTECCIFELRAFAHPYVRNIHVCADTTLCFLGDENYFNPLPSELFYSIFYPFEVASRCRDPQLQVGENNAHICLI